MLNLSLNFIEKIKSTFFPFYKNKELRFILKRLEEGYTEDKTVVRFVGGCVRKYLSGEKIDDIDAATILTTDQIKEKLQNTNLKIIDTGIKHGTVTVLSDTKKIELTTLRKDVKTDGRHAEIEYTDDWQLDSERRDFTMNAIYMDINGKIFDPQNGIGDLKNKNVKFIGDPQKRIEEDYLRIIRFIRFKVMYDIQVEKTTIEAIKHNLTGIKKISKERILDELLKILELKSFLKINESDHLKEIFLMIFPEFLYLNRLERLKKICKYSNINKDLLLAVLIIDDKNNDEYFSHKYNVSSKIKETLKKLSSNLIEVKKNKNFFGKDLIRNVYFYGKEHLINLNIINFSINPKIKIDEFSKILNLVLKSNVPKLHVNGEYLKKNGMKEGESLGKVLKKIESEWASNNFEISNERIKDLIKIYSL
tara:strand:+ start:3877 stop:5139 length:1263 start_codon:yes stop_codon:yes gene_type:complete